MLTFSEEIKKKYSSIDPVCPVFGTCGGCFFQDVQYSDELAIKSEALKDLLQSSLTIDDSLFDEVISSPKEYQYRHRLDLKLKKTKEGDVFIGYTPAGHRGVVEVDHCPIAMKPVNDFIPQLKKEAIKKLPAKYKMANLCVRTDDTDRVFWGGIGKGSLEQNPQDYLFTEILGKKVYYSMDTFFQANLSILNSLIEVLNNFDIWDGRTYFYDLYGGVGLFSVALSDKVEKTCLIENTPSSIKLAEYNKTFHQLDNMTVIYGRVEEKWNDLINIESHVNLVAMIDPPRAGLSKTTRQLLIDDKRINHLMYLSCNPEALARDLEELCESTYIVEKIIPFDFFPRTRHLETLVLMKQASS